MTSTLRRVYHVAAFGWYAIVVKYLSAKEGEELPAGIFLYGGPWKYLTFLNLLLQMSFFGLAALNDLQAVGKSESTLRRFKDLLFSVFAFPVGMHTFVLPVLLGEVLVQPHIYPQTKYALAMLGGVGLAYLLWIVWVYLSVGIWVYPLLAYFSTAGLVGFFFFNMSMVVLLYVLGDKLNSHVWKKDMNQMTTKAKPQPLCK
ncbi:androgen-dependent TFPI-regulating protein isoform 2-T2 [Spinachia spinachia]